MAHVIINGTTFDGLGNGTGNQSALQPTGYTARERKVGMTLVAADGTRNRVERSVTKREWELAWENTNLATYQAVRTIQRLYTTFAFTDIEAAAYTVQTEDDDFEAEHAFVSAGGVHYYSITLHLLQV